MTADSPTIGAQMDIHFCDLCNESVPQIHLEEGRAFIRKGRVICATCEGLMSGEPDQDPASSTSGDFTSATDASGRPVPNAAREARRVEQAAIAAGGSGGAMLAGMLAIAAMMLVGGVAVILSKRMDETAGQVRGELASGQVVLREDLSGLQGRFNDREVALAGTLATLQAQFEALTAEAGRTVIQNAELARALRDDVERIDARLAALDGIGERIARDEQSAVQLAADISVLKDDIVILTEGLLELENRMVGVSVGDLVGAGGGAGEGPPPWMGLAEDLNSPNSGTRWNAVQALGETHDPAVIPHLVPMLKDDDIFVRMATARILGDLEHPVAIPALIDALEDREPSVREAAVVSLRALSSRNFKFDPSASESERAKRVKAWRDWWKKAEAGMLGGEEG